MEALVLHEGLLERAAVSIVIRVVVVIRGVLDFLGVFLRIFKRILVEVRKVTSSRHERVDEEILRRKSLDDR